MDLDFNDFVLDEEETEAEAPETEEAEEQDEAPEREAKPEEATKPQQQEQPRIDRSKPLEERLREGRDNLKFAAGLMGDYQKAAAMTFCCHLLDVLADPNEQKRSAEIREKFDQNEWTFEELFNALSERFRKELGNRPGAVSGEIVMGWAYEIIITTKPKDYKKAESKFTPPTISANKTPKKAKPEPKKDHEQLTLEFDL